MKIAPAIFSIFYNVFPFSLHRLVSYVIVLCFLMQTGKKKKFLFFSPVQPQSQLFECAFLQHVVFTQVFCNPLKQNELHLSSFDTLYLFIFITSFQHANFIIHTYVCRNVLMCLSSPLDFQYLVGRDLAIHLES